MSHMVNHKDKALNEGQLSHCYQSMKESFNPSMANKNSTKFDLQDSSSPSIEEESNPQGNDNSTLLPTHFLETNQENESGKSGPRNLSRKAEHLENVKGTLHGMALRLGHEHEHEDEDATCDKQPIEDEANEEDNGRERLKRHRVDVAGRVWIPDIWGQEDFLKDWIDCSVFEASLASSGIMSARAALVDQAKREHSSTSLRIGNRC